MSLPALLTALTVLALAFWAAQLFALVMTQRREAAQRSGQSYAGLRDGAQTWLEIMRAPRHRGARWRLLLATLTLLALLLLRLWV